MTMTITFDPETVLRRERERWRQALPSLAAQVLADCNRYARDDTGALIRSSQSASRLAEGKLIWRTPYARRVYYTGAPSPARNPEASLRWCEKAKALHAAAWTALAARELGGG